MTRKKRRSFTAAQKAEAVRKHLKDRVPVSQIADEMKVQPTVIHNWIHAALGQAEHVFDSPRIISDNGPQFLAKDFKAFVRLSRRQQSQNESLALAG